MSTAALGSELQTWSCPLLRIRRKQLRFVNCYRFQWIFNCFQVIYLKIFPNILGLSRINYRRCQNIYVWTSISYNSFEKTFFEPQCLQFNRKIPEYCSSMPPTHQKGSEILVLNAPNPSERFRIIGGQCPQGRCLAVSADALGSELQTLRTRRKQLWMSWKKWTLRICLQFISFLFIF